MTNGRRLAAVLLAFPLAAAACRRDTRTPLTLYSPHGRDLLALVEKTYEAAHPEIDVRWLDMGSQEVYDRIRSEKANPQADVWFGGPNTIFARGVRDGLLAAYRPSWAVAIPEESRGPRDLYFGLYRTPAVIVYNSAVVAAADAPHDWDDILAPRFKGKVLIRDPLASGTMRAIFGLVIMRSIAETGNADRGFAWLSRLDGQTKEYVVNATLLLEKLGRREGLVTLWDLPDVLLEQKHGLPLASVFPPSGTPVIDDAIGLVAGSKHPKEAQALVEWLGSIEAQRLAAERAFRLPARLDIPSAELPAWARDVESRLVAAKMDWDLLEREGPEWMARWDRTVRGRAAR
ncbi:MAG TPA: extracellular solute-binding protein [Thermoanaerobaculia bacterium]|nr:extracellular solute-binding protein [Thermoanaerobaculia bacterium]